MDYIPPKLQTQFKFHLLCEIFLDFIKYYLLFTLPLYYA